MPSWFPTTSAPLLVASAAFVAVPSYAFVAAASLITALTADSTAVLVTPAALAVSAA